MTQMLYLQERILIILTVSNNTNNSYSLIKEKDQQKNIDFLNNNPELVEQLKAFLSLENSNIINSILTNTNEDNTDNNNTINNNIEIETYTKSNINTNEIALNSDNLNNLGISASNRDEPTNTNLNNNQNMPNISDYHASELVNLIQTLNQESNSENYDDKLNLINEEIRIINNLLVVSAEKWLKLNQFRF